jgi:uncharacterized surface protein with fasciclin (FAS1) repeats
MRTIMIVACAASLLPLMAGCSDKKADGTVTEQAAKSSGSLAEQLGKSAGHARVARALNETGLGGIFAGKDSYTLLAPDDNSLARLEGGGGQAKLEGEASRAALAALLRNHILPGTVTPKDIGAAIDKAGDGKVTMRTMGDGEIVFSRQDGAIMAATGDGAVARLSSSPLIMGGSAAIPIEGVLKKG